MGEKSTLRSREVAALRLGLDLGLALIDTAEMYANGGAEEVVGDAIQGRRDEVFLVSKVLPQHASRRGTVQACEQSLKRLKTDHLDAYLLHWRGGVPLQETVGAFQDLQRKGLIRSWGVSNFDVDDMEELVSLGYGGDVALNQVLYNPSARGIEFDLLAWARSHRSPVMAYSPIGQGELTRNTVIAALAAEHAATPAQVILAWVLRQPEVIAIPKASNAEHVMENRAAMELELTSRDLAQLDEAFPPPTREQPLEML